MKQEDWWINKQDFKERKEYIKMFGRKIKDDEIVIEADYPCPEPLIATMTTLRKLMDAGYMVEVWRACGMFCSHLHIKNIIGLNKLSDKVRKKYREVFIKEYVDEEFYPYIDKALFSKHRIAEENKKHFKYGTYKILESQHNIEKVNKLERHLVKRAEIELQREVYSKRHFHRDKNKPGESILTVASEYELEVNRYGMAMCPFHDDTHASLSINEDMGCFNCFGCNKHGNIAEFRKLLKEVKNG